jgi:plasmid maintenance system antidote protein VapI
MRLSKALNTSARLWLNMQSAVDAYDAEKAAEKWKPKKVFEAA